MPPIINKTMCILVIFIMVNIQLMTLPMIEVCYNRVRLTLNLKKPSKLSFNTIVHFLLGIILPGKIPKA